MQAEKFDYPILRVLLAQLDEHWDIVTLYEVFHTNIEWKRALLLKIRKGISWEVFIGAEIIVDEDLLDTWKDVDWSMVSSLPMTEEAMAKFEDELDWPTISLCQKLSEEFVDKFCDKLCWTSLCAIQDFSAEFLLRHKERLDVTALWYRRKVLGEEFIESLGKVEKNVLEKATCWINEEPKTFVYSLNLTRDIISNDGFWDD